MVKRVKLTLKHAEVEELDFPESIVTEQSIAADSKGKGNLVKILIMAGLTIASLIVFKQKIF